MTIRSDLDELIDWYEANQPLVVGRVIPVAATEGTIAQFASKRRIRGGPYMYRDCEIIAVRKSRKDRNAAPIQTELQHEGRNIADDQSR